MSPAKRSVAVDRLPRRSRWGCTRAQIERPCFFFPLFFFFSLFFFFFFVFFFFFFFLFFFFFFSYRCWRRVGQSKGRQRVVRISNHMAEQRRRAGDHRTDERRVDVGNRKSAAAGPKDRSRRSAQVARGRCSKEGEQSIRFEPPRLLGTDSSEQRNRFSSPASDSPAAAAIKESTGSVTQAEKQKRSN